MLTLASLVLAGAVGTLPSSILRVCFNQDLSSVCFERVSGFDTINICRDLYNEPFGNVVYTNYVTLGYTHPHRIAAGDAEHLGAGEFEVVYKANAVSRFQSGDTLYIIEDEDAIFNGGDFEYCQTYRT